MGSRRGFAVVCGVVSALVAGCGSERAPAAAAQTSSAEALAAGAVTVYDDTLASNWWDWSWSSTRSFANASPVAAGTSSLAVTLQAWGGLSLHDGGGTISGMSSLVLSVNGGSASSDLNVFATSGGTAGTVVALAQYCAAKAIPANAWTKCTVPLAALGMAGKAVDGLGLRDPAGAARATFYLDDVGFAPAAPTAPAGLTATAATGSIALSWGAVSGATGYDVYRATASGGPFSRLTASSQSGTTYSDAAVTAGATYWYQVTASGAGGASAASATVSATAPAAGGTGGGTAVTVYGDALASGWYDWSWSTTRDFASTSTVASGKSSLAVTFQAWGGLSFHDGGTPLTGMSSIVLSVNGGTASGDLQIFATQGGTASAMVALGQYCAAKTIPAGAWTRCTVPLSALGLAGVPVDGVGLRESTGNARATMYFDDIGFVSGSGTTQPPATVPAAPAGLSAAAVSGRVSIAWNAVSGATGYDVYRATSSGGTFTKLTAAPQTGTTYADAAVTAGSTYWYQVKAVNAAGSSAASNTASATVPATPPAVTVAITPATATLDACKALKLTAAVSGATDGSVTWSVQEGSAGGTVDASGNYTAPNAAGTFHVVATSKASPTATATVPVVVQQRVLSVAVVPLTASLTVSGAQQFAATVTTTCGTFAAQ